MIQPYLFVMNDSFPVIGGMFNAIRYGVMLFTLSDAPNKKRNFCQMAESEIEKKTAMPRFYWNFP